MIKLFSGLCFVCVFVDLASSTLQGDAKKLLSQLKSEVEPKFQEFEEKNIKWQNDVYDAVKAFDVKVEKDLDVELKRLNGIIDGLKKKSSKCVEEQKSEIAALSGIGRSYSSCSSQIAASTEKNMGQLQNQVSGLKGKYQSFDDRLKDCKDVEACLKSLISALEAELKTLPPQIDGYVKNAKDLRNNKKRDLKGCSTVSKLTTAGEDIIKKINACAV